MIPRLAGRAAACGPPTAIARLGSSRVAKAPSRSRPISSCAPTPSPNKLGAVAPCTGVALPVAQAFCLCQLANRRGFSCRLPPGSSHLPFLGAAPFFARKFARRERPGHQELSRVHKVPRVRILPFAFSGAPPLVLRGGSVLLSLVAQVVRRSVVGEGGDLRLF